MNSKNYKVWSAFIRGFSDCDGSLNFGKRYGKYKEALRILHTYPRIQLKSVSHKLMKDISILLTRLEVNHKIYTLRNKKERQKDCCLIEIKGKKALEEWMRKIGFNNPVQTTRYKIFKKYGFVPPKTNIYQRKSILKGEIDPCEFYPQGIKKVIKETF